MIFGGYGLYILFSLPALLLGLWAQFKVKTAFTKYSKITTTTQLSGSEVARRMLDQNNLQSINIEISKGVLSDHYDPASKTLRLSEEVYRSSSIAAAGVAAHESGHAIQDLMNYAPLRMRSIMIPSVKLGSWLGPIVFMLGMIMSSRAGTTISYFGLLLFAATAVFALITLPVEIDASNRAKSWLTDSGIIYASENEGIKSILDAAALTYVAGAVQAITTVLYYAFLLSGRSRRN